MDGGGVIIKTLYIIFHSLSVNVQYMCALPPSDRYIGAARHSHFKKAERRWQRKWCETGWSAMSYPHWPSTANNNAMKHWAEVKNIPSSLLPPSRHPCLSSHCLNKYPINYSCPCIGYPPDRRLKQNTRLPKQQLTHFLLPLHALMENNRFVHFVISFVQLIWN